MSEQIRPNLKKPNTEEKNEISKEILSNSSSDSQESMSINEKPGLNREEYSLFPEVPSSKNTIQIDSDSIDTQNKSIFSPFPSGNSKIEQTMHDLDEAKRDPFEKLTEEFESLSTLEKDILSIAESVLKKKKYSAELDTERVEMMSPLVEQLYSKCIAKLTHTRGISKETIFSTIQDLKEKFWIVTDQRRTRYEIINSPILKNVLKFIHEHPGTHARDPAITEELGITRNPFIKHVMVLDAFGMIRTKKIGRTLNYFVHDVPETFDDFVVMFSNPLVVQIIMLLMQENLGLSEIARRLGVYHGAIQYHIKTLASMDLILKDEKDLQVNIALLKKYNSLYKVPPFHLHFK